MGALLKAYNIVNERKKAIVIAELLSLGVNRSASLNELPYNELKRMLAMERVKRER